MERLTYDKPDVYICEIWKNNKDSKNMLKRYHLCSHFSSPQMVDAVTAKRDIFELEHDYMSSKNFKTTERTYIRKYPLTHKVKIKHLPCLYGVVKH